MLGGVPTTAESRTLVLTKSVALGPSSLACTLVRYKMRPFLQHGTNVQNQAPCLFHNVMCSDIRLLTTDV